MNGPSKHLSWVEVACNDGTPYPQQFIRDGRVFRLAQAFEDIRHLCGDRPITVFSAYRTPNWNRKVGGAPKSQHVEGRALDLKPPEGLTVKQFYDLIKANHKEFGIQGIGLYKTFVHIDIRPSTVLVAWRGTSLKESKTA
jgi:uncharacterized protein YcbK (DUF882 family)